MNKKYCFVINPAAGNRKGLKAAAAVRRIFSKQQFDIITTTKEKNAAETVSEYLEKNTADIIIACGGDGTVYETLQPVMKHHLKLGIVPCGTVNVAARELGIPLDIEAAVKKTAECNFSTVDIGQWNDSYFMLMAGIGFDAQVIRKTSSQLKKYCGTLAYALRFIIDSIFYKETFAVIKIKDRNIYGYQVIIQNFKYYGGAVAFDPSVSPHDGLLDVFIFKTNSPITRVMNVIRCIFGISMKYVEKIRTDELYIEHIPHIPVHLDAEMVSAHSAYVKIHHNALDVCI